MEKQIKIGLLPSGFVLLIVFLILLFPVTVRADMGPKPSVTVEFTGLEDEVYYVTLLSDQAGKAAWRGENDYLDWYGDKAVWEKFRDYASGTEFHFWGYFEECSETDMFCWNYYAPDRFKILLYFPETDTFLESGECWEQYAFDSYFAAEFSGEISGGEMKVWKSYDYGREIRGMIFRVALTLVVELLAAWMFRFRSLKDFLVIFAANLVTQTSLNMALNAIVYHNGPREYVLHYIWMEAAIFVVEGAVYSTFLGQKGKRNPWLYAVAANVASLSAGIFLAQLFPAFF